MDDGRKLVGEPLGEVILGTDHLVAFLLIEKHMGFDLEGKTLTVEARNESTGEVSRYVGCPVEDAGDAWRVNLLAPGVVRHSAAGRA